MKTKIYVFTILILILNLFSVNAANYGGDLKIKVDQRPFNLNPIYGASETALMIDKQIFDTLVNYNNQEEIAANLAESWEINNDSTLFEFQLKKEVYFHPYKIDGKEVPLNEREVSAENWKWSFEYLAVSKNKSPYAELLNKVKGYDEYRQGKSQEISGIRVKNKFQLEIELKESYAPFIYNLAKSAAVVMPANAVLSNDFNFSTAPVGTGAFEYGNFSKNKVTLLKNNNYWKNNYQEEKQPYLNQIEINFSAENNLKENLQEFDLFQLNSAEFFAYQEQKDEYSDYQITKFVNNYFYFAGLNYNSNLSQDENYNDLKEGLSYIINENNFIENLNLDNFILPADNINSQPFLFKLSKNLQNSKNINLNDSLKELKLAVNDSKTNIQIANQLKNELKTENINLDIKKYNWAEYLNRLNTRNLNSNLFMMSADYNNRFEFIRDNLYSTSKANYFGYQNKRLDNLIDYLKLVNNKQNSERAFEIITDIIIGDNPFVFLFQGADSYLVSDRLVNQDIFKNMYLKYDFERLYFK